MKEFEPRDPVDLLKIRQRVGLPKDIPQDYLEAITLIAQKLRAKLRKAFEDDSSDSLRSLRVIMESLAGYPISTNVAKYIEIGTDFYVVEPAAELIETHDQNGIVKGAIVMDLGHGIQYISRQIQILSSSDYQSSLEGFQSAAIVEPTASVESLMGDWSRYRMIFDRDPRGFLIADCLLDEMRKGKRPTNTWELKKAVIFGAETGVSLYKELYPSIARLHRKQQN